MDILLSALTEAVLGEAIGLIVEDVANRPLLRALQKRVASPSAEQQALERAIQSAYRAFDAAFPDLTASFFDSRFLRQTAVIAELAKLLTPHRRPNLDLLDRLWLAQLPGIKRSIAAPLAKFVAGLEDAILAEPELRSFTDSRSLQAMLQQLAQQTDLASQSLVALQEIAANTRRRQAQEPAPPFMAGPWPASFVDRPELYEEVIAWLLPGDTRPVAISPITTLKGAGGFGKTTLAQAICHDDRIRRAFPDGILWVTLGEDQVRLLPAIATLCSSLSGETNVFTTEHEAVLRLTGLLADRRCLLVIDDVWQPSHLAPFLQGGPRCARLITTRIADVIPTSSTVVTVDVMDTSQAVALLGHDLPGRTAALLGDLAAQLFGWPLLLSIVNRRLFEDVVRNGVTLSTAVQDVRDQLQALGLTALDVGNDKDRSRAVAACIRASLKHLRGDAAYGRERTDEVMRFAELAIFPDDVAVPVNAVAVLWQQTGGLSLAVAKALCRRLAALALLQRYDPVTMTISLHAVVRRYLIDSTELDQYRAWQSALVQGYYVRCAGQWWQLPNDGYAYQRLPWHLANVEEWDQLEMLLSSYRWLSAKLQVADVVGTVADFDLHCDRGRHTRLGLLQHALRMSASVLARDRTQLASQLYGRLAGLGDDWWPLLKEVEVHARSAWLRPKAPTLTPPGGSLLFGLSGHSDAMSNLLLASDDRLITSCGGHWSSDYTVKVWDLEHGALLYSLEGHTCGVNHLLLAADDRLITACSAGRLSHDHTVKVWDLEHGALLHSLEGHGTGVTKLLLTPDGRLVVAGGSYHSPDHTVKVWDITSGTLLHSLEGHGDVVTELLLAPNGHLITACGSHLGDDHTVKVWDLSSGALLYSLAGHTSAVENLLLTPDGRLVTSGSASSYNDDHTVKVWNLERGTLLHSLVGHTAGVDNLLLAPGDRLVTSSGYPEGCDHTVKVWDLSRGTLLHSLEGHADRVNHLLLTPTGYLITACGNHVGDDHTVKVWDLERGMLLHTLTGHTAGVDNLLLADDNCLITACGKYSRDHTVKIWDFTSGVLLHTLKGHTAGVENLLAVQDGRLITSCGAFGDDDTVKVWDVASGAVLHSLAGNTAGVTNLLLVRNSRLITTCSGDHTAKVWDLEHSDPQDSPLEHAARVTRLLLTENGRLLSTCRSSGSDYSVKVWDVERGTLLHSLVGHKDNVDSLLLAGDDHLITSTGSRKSRDHAVNVWDLSSGQLLHSLTGHTAGVDNLLLAGDGRLVTSCGDKWSSDHTVKVWDLRSGRLLHSLEGHRAGVSSLLLTVDGRLVTACSSDRKRVYDPSVKVWDIERGTLVHTLEGHAAGVDKLALAPAGRLITACGDNIFIDEFEDNFDHRVMVWDLSSGALVHELTGHTYGVFNLILTPDSHLVTSCAVADHTIKIWDLDRGVPVHTLTGHTYGVSRLVLAQKNCLITACGFSSFGTDFTVKVWDLARGVLLHSLEGHKANVNSLLVTPDGHLVTAGDVSVKVWDLARGVLLHSLEAHYQYIQQQLFDAARSLLVTIGGNECIVWNLATYQSVAQFTADGAIAACLLAPDGTIILGDTLGRVHFLTLEKPAAVRR